MPDTYLPLTNDLLVNTTETGNQNAQSVALLPSGGFVVVWRSQASAGAEINGQIFDETGLEVRGEFPVASDGLSPLVTPLASGGFLVSWEVPTSNAFGAPVDIKGRVYDTAGVPVGDELTLATDVERGHDIEGLPDGGFALAFIEEFHAGVLGRTFDADGDPVSSAFTVADSGPEGAIGAVGLTLVGSDRLAFAWSSFGSTLPGGTTDPVAAQLVDFTGDPIGSRIQFDVVDQNSSFADIEGLSADRFILLWSKDINGSTAYFADLFDDSGSRLAQVQFEDAARRIVELPDGSFFVFFESTAQQFSADLQPFGDAFRVDQEGVVQAIEVTTLSSSNFVVTWTTNDSDFQGVEARLFGPLGAPLDLSGTAGNDTLRGGNADDILRGLGGNDVLLGGFGSDRTEGGPGNDIHVVDTSLDRVLELPGEGFDTVRSRVTYTLSANVERLELIGSADINGAGNALANELIGNSANNLLNGLGGADTMRGGLGDDVYIVDNVGDRVLEALNAGTDRVQSSVTYTLLSNIENLTLTGTANINGAGNGLANLLIGNSGNNLLNGLAGVDTMKGGNGDDVYIVDNAGDVVQESSPTGGTDRVQSSVSFTIGAFIENLTLTGSGNVNGTGNGSANVIDGNGGANALFGLAGDDYLRGGAGGDSLHGGLGADRLNGSSGADGFFFDTALGSGNVDRIEDYVVADDTIFLENAVFAGLAPGTLSANAFVIGSAAADADDRIIYNSATGALLFDADGSGAGAAVQFATLASGLAMTASEFQVI